MAIAYIASTIEVTGTGDNAISGPVDVTGITVPTGTVTISKGGVTIATLSAGTYSFKIRSAGGLTVNGACTLTLTVHE